MMRGRGIRRMSRLAGGAGIGWWWSSYARCIITNTANFHFFSTSGDDPWYVLNLTVNVRPLDEMTLMALREPES